VLDADDLDMCTLVWATVSYVVANLDDLLPRHNDFAREEASTLAHRLVALLTEIVELL